MICANLQKIRSIIEETARGCGRDPKEVKLVAVSKYMPAAMITEAHQCDQVLFGENYLQHAEEKITQLPLLFTGILLVIYRAIKQRWPLNSFR